MGKREALVLGGVHAVQALRTDGPVVDALITAARRDVGWLPDGSGQMDEQAAWEDALVQAEGDLPAEPQHTGG